MFTRLSVCRKIGGFLGFITALFTALIKAAPEYCSTCTPQNIPGIWDHVFAGVISGFIAAIFVGFIASRRFNYKMQSLLILSVVIGILTGISSGIIAFLLKNMAVIVFGGAVVGIIIGWLICRLICGSSIRRG